MGCAEIAVANYGEKCCARQPQFLLLPLEEDFSFSPFIRPPNLFSEVICFDHICPQAFCSLLARRKHNANTNLQGQ
jgi:hypothetical protein